MLHKNKYCFLLFIVGVFFANLLKSAIPKPPPLPPKKEKIAKIEKTQIEAQMSVELLKKMIENTYSKANESEMIKDMTNQARSLMKDFYEFYHAQHPGFRVVQDTYKKIFEFFYITAQLKSFTFFRFKDPMFDKYENSAEFLQEELKNNGIIDDNLKDTKTYIMSVNLSPFGNVGTPGEATFDYFRSGFSHFDPSSLLEELFSKFGLDKSFIPKLNELGEFIHTAEGNLFQIFIPKKIVDHIVYVAWRHGIPFDEAFLETFFGGIKAPHYFIEKGLEFVRTGHKKGLPVFKNYLEELKDKINLRQFYVSNVLDTYRKSPENLPYLNFYQARILLTNEYILNPESGIKIYRYTTVPKKDMKEYYKRLNKIIDSLLRDWVVRNYNNPMSELKKEDLNKVQRLFKFIQEGKGNSITEIDPSQLYSHVLLMQELKEKFKTMEEKKHRDRLAVNKRSTKVKKPAKSIRVKKPD